MDTTIDLFTSNIPDEVDLNVLQFLSNEFARLEKNLNVEMNEFYERQKELIHLKSIQSPFYNVDRMHTDLLVNTISGKKVEYVLAEMHRIHEMYLREIFGTWMRRHVPESPILYSNFNTVPLREPFDYLFQFFREFVNSSNNVLMLDRSTPIPKICEKPGCKNICDIYVCREDKVRCHDIDKYRGYFSDHRKHICTCAVKDGSDLHPYCEDCMMSSVVNNWTHFISLFKDFNENIDSQKNERRYMIPCLISCPVCQGLLCPFNLRKALFSQQQPLTTPAFDQRFESFLQEMRHFTSVMPSISQAPYGNGTVTSFSRSDSNLSSPGTPPAIYPSQSISTPRTEKKCSVCGKTKHYKSTCQKAQAEWNSHLSANRHGVLSK